MKTIAWFSSLIVSSALAAAPDSQTEKNFFNATPKEMAADKGGFGVDYKFNWSFDNKPTGKAADASAPAAPESYQFNLDGNGFIASDSAKNTANALETNLNAAYKNKLSLPDWWFGGDAMAKAMGLKALVKAGLTATAQSTQDMRTYNYSIGPTLRTFAPLPLLGSLLPNNGLDLKVGYNRLLSRKFDDKTLAATTDKRKDVLTFRFDQGFSLPFLPNQIVEVSYTGNYFFEDSIPADKLGRYADFLAIRASLFDLPDSVRNFLSAKGSRFAVIYTTGKLPPVYQKGTSIGGGFSLDY